MKDDNALTIAYMCGYRDAKRDIEQLPEIQELRDALERCRFALEPYDDVKPRDWKTDRENLRDAHRVVCSAIAAMGAENMTQSRRASLLESAANIAVGYGVAVAAQVVVFPMFGINVPLSDNLQIGGLFTLVSLVRSYCLRRLFNKMPARGKKQ